MQVNLKWSNAMMSIIADLWLRTAIYATLAKIVQHYGANNSIHVALSLRDFVPHRNATHRIAGKINSR